MNLGQWIGLSSLIISGYIIWEIRQILLLIFTAVLFATALNRLVNWLGQFSLKRNLAIIITLVFTLLLTLLFIWLIVPPFLEQFQNLIQVWERLRDTLIFLGQTDLPEQLQPLVTELFKNFFAFFSNSITAILQLIFVFVLTVMMVVNPQGYRKTLLRLFPSFYRRRADEILTLSETALGNWLIGITISCFFIGLLSGLGLWIFQVNLVLVHALLAGLLNFIPNIGPTASVIFPIVVALSDSPWKIWAILILYFVIQNIESYWLTPTIMAKQVSLLPAVTLIAQIFFTNAFGLLGLLLALPLTVVAKTWIDEFLFKDILDSWTKGV